MTKTAILNEIAERAEISRKQVASVLDELDALIDRHIKSGAAGEFTLPGLLKVRSREAPGDQAAHGSQSSYR